MLIICVWEGMIDHYIDPLFAHFPFVQHLLSIMCLKSVNTRLPSKFSLDFPKILILTYAFFFKFRICLLDFSIVWSHVNIHSNLPSIHMKTKKYHEKHAKLNTSNRILLSLWNKPIDIDITKEYDIYSLISWKNVIWKTAMSSISTFSY